MGKKALEELVFHDDFMFAGVMMEEENCRCFLERVLEMAIEKVEISTEHSFFFNPECKSIRMDVFAKDVNRTHYDIEMQLVKKDSLEKRSRYYHSQMDMEMLEKGKRYSELPDAYVIFVCNFDPLGEKKCRYTIRKHCEETGRTFADGVCTVFLNTKGENRDEVPKELAALLDFVKADLAGSEADYEDPFVEQLQNSMRRIKNSRRMGERYMMFEQYMQEYVQEHADEIREEARAEGLKQGRTEGLEQGRAEGREQGLEQGLEQGREQGLEEGMTRLNKLNFCLLSANRLSDLQRALQDPEYQKKLLQEFGI